MPQRRGYYHNYCFCMPCSMPPRGFLLEGHACSNCVKVMFNDSQGVLTHFNGLEELIRRRGGLGAFSSNPVVRTVIFWYISSCRETVGMLFNIDFSIGLTSIPHSSSIESHDSPYHTIFCPHLTSHLSTPFQISHCYNLASRRNSHLPSTTYLVLSNIC